VTRFLLVCAGGAAGTGARYLIGLAIAARTTSAFPYATLLVNVLGCFLLAVVLQLALSVPSFPGHLRAMLATGFMGGLTTYSTFNHETTRLFQGGDARTASLYLIVTLLGCAVAGLAGMALARRLAGA
jgi:fluoride exporter